MIVLSFLSLFQRFALHDSSSVVSIFYVSNPFFLFEHRQKCVQHFGLGHIKLRIHKKTVRKKMFMALVHVEHLCLVHIWFDYFFSKISKIIVKKCGTLLLISMVFSLLFLVKLEKIKISSLMLAQSIDWWFHLSSYAVLFMNEMYLHQDSYGYLFMSI